MEKKIISKNGKRIALEDASVSIFDMGFSRGVAAFELLRTYCGEPCGLHSHVERMFASARELGLEISMNEEALKEHILELFDMWGETEAQAKLYVWAKGEQMRLIPDSSCDLFVIVSAVDPFERKPLKLKSIPFARNLPLIKSTNYAHASVSLRKARLEGFDDIVYVDSRGRFTECSTSNIFFVRSGQLITPKSGMLEGVTRQKVIDLFDVIQRDVYFDELVEFDEVFLTSSVREIAPIEQIDRIPFASPGKVTQEVLERYISHTSSPALV